MVLVKYDGRCFLNTTWPVYVFHWHLLHAYNFRCNVHAITTPFSRYFALRIRPRNIFANGTGSIWELGRGVESMNSVMSIHDRPLEHEVQIFYASTGSHRRPWCPSIHQCVRLSEAACSNDERFYVIKIGEGGQEEVPASVCSKLGGGGKERCLPRSVQNWGSCHSCLPRSCALGLRPPPAHDVPSFSAFIRTVIHSPPAPSLSWQQANK